MSAIARLDASLARRGQDIVLRRTTTPPTDLSVRANVRPVTPDEVTGGIVAGDLMVVVSPTGLDKPSWIAAFALTGGVSQSAPFNVDPKLPKKGDLAIINNRRRTIEAVMPIYVNGELVRIELQARG